MSLGFAIPTLALIGFSALLGIVRWPLPPRLVLPVVTALACITAGIVATLVAATVAGFSLGFLGTPDLPGWCRVVLLEHEVGDFEGVAATAAMLVMAFRIRNAIHRPREVARRTRGRRIAIVETTEPLAYAAPGRPGCVVVSTGLLSHLAPRERQAVFAHERAHLTQHHHRYLLAAAIAQAVNPALRPLVGRLRLATEQCADEAAANALGGDRWTVARAIGKAAVTTTAHGHPLPAFAGGQVVQRVEALIGPPPTRAASALRFGVTTIGTALFLSAGSIQLHNLWALIDHICEPAS